MFSSPVLGRIHIWVVYGHDKALAGPLLPHFFAAIAADLNSKAKPLVSATMWGPQTIAKLVYNSNNYGLLYL